MTRCPDEGGHGAVERNAATSDVPGEEEKFLHDGGEFQLAFPTILGHCAQSLPGTYRRVPTIFGRMHETRESTVFAAPSYRRTDARCGELKGKNARLMAPVSYMSSPASACLDTISAKGAHEAGASRYA